MKKPVPEIVRLWAIVAAKAGARLRYQGEMIETSEHLTRLDRLRNAVRRLWWNIAQARHIRLRRMTWGKRSLYLSMPWAWPAKLFGYGGIVFLDFETVRQLFRDAVRAIGKRKGGLNDKDWREIPINIVTPGCMATAIDDREE